MDRNDLRQRALEAIKQVNWTPAWGEERISNMIATRPDWCISRQRAWGVPIIVFYCEGCQEPLTDRKILDRIVGLIREQTADVWYSQSAERAGRSGREVRQMRRSVFPQRNRHSRCLVRFRRQPSGRAHAKRTTCPGPPTCIWKAAISIAAGSILRC